MTSVSESRPVQKTARTTRAARALGVGVLSGSLLLGFGTAASIADDVPADETTASATPTPEDLEAQSDIDKGSTPQGSVQAAAATPPYGASMPVTLETNFSRPYKAISSASNSDFSLLNDLERLIRGSYRNPNTNKLRGDRRSNSVFMSISRMENSKRVGRELVRAAQNGVNVYVIHGKASQSKESRALQSKLGKLKRGHFKICQKGKSLACLGKGSGAIMHSKILLINSTYTRDKKPARGVIWSGSANLGGPSGERTYNNGLTVYNDRKLWTESRRMWADMWAKRNIGTDYLSYVRKHKSRYGLSASVAAKAGYTRANPDFGMFYSNLANVTIYATPIRASPTNGKDPVLNMLNRIVPDDQCRIRLQENRFKYRRIAVAQKLVQLANDGCKISGVYFEDDLKVNRVAHCQMYIRICRPILDVFKTANQRIETAWAKPHDKTIMVDAKMRYNRLNKEEVSPSGKGYKSWPNGGERVQLVQAGSAALTGSNLVASDEITTETTDPAVFDDYLQHWKAIWKSKEIRNYPY